MPSPGLAMSESESPYNVDHYIEDRREFFRRAWITLGFNGIDGDYAEFGCHSGRTFGLAYQEFQKAKSHLGFLPYIMERLFWALDSFKGLPSATGPEDSHPFWVEGTLATTRAEFEQICHNNGIAPSAYHIVEGFYADSLTESSTQLPDNICLAYIDCDMYSSIMTVLEFLLPRIKHGMILAFDDYFVYSRDQVSGARRACVRMLGDHPNWRILPYYQFAWGGLSFIVESKSVMPDSL